MPTIFNEIIHVLFHIIFALMALMAVILIYLAVTIRPRFEKLFKDTLPSLSYNYVRYGKKMGRFSDYLDLINAYDSEKEYNTPEYRCYDGFNFPEHVSKFEFLMVKLYFFILYTWGIFFAIACGIILFFNEQHESNFLHKLSFLLFPLTITSGIITLIPYFYLKKRIIPRFEKMMQQNPLPSGCKILIMGYIKLLSNYASQQRHNTLSYRLIKPYDFLAHVSSFERLLGKTVWRVGIVFLASSIATFIWIGIRAYML